LKTKEEIIATLRAPVFIVGTPRSGTTWLQRLLVSHSDILGGKESAFFIGFQGAFNNILQKNEKRRESLLLEYWQEAALKEKMHDLWMETFSGFVKEGVGDVFCEKSPSHALHIEAVNMILPAAKIIHIIRDSRSTTASMLAASKGWGKYWAPKTAKDAAISWYLHVSKARKSGVKLGPERYMEVFYEDLKDETPKQLERIFDFVGVEYDSQLIQNIVAEQKFNQQKKIGGTPFSNLGGNTQEPEGFFRKGQACSWKKDLSLMQKIIVWRFTRKLMKEVGYTWSGRRQ